MSRIRQIFNTSNTILFIKLMGRYYYSIKKRIMDLYCYSQTYRLSMDFWTGAKLNFRYCFFGRITEINKNNTLVLNNSIFIQWLLNVYRKWKDYSRQSKFADFIRMFNGELYLKSVKTAGIILTVALLMNIIFSIVMHKEIGLLGWVARLIFTTISMCGIFSQATWEDIERTSLIFKAYNKISAGRK